MKIVRVEERAAVHANGGDQLAGVREALEEYRAEVGPADVVSFIVPAGKGQRLWQLTATLVDDPRWLA